LKRALVIVVAVSTLLPFVVAAAPSAQSPHSSWDTAEKCVSKDWDGRRIPTRIGNAELGWRHFSGPHNIKSCKLINAAIDGKPDKWSDNKRNLEYWGSAISKGRQVNFVVKVRYAKETDDGRYTAPGRKRARIGVITAYCRGMKKCPNWVI
jgi:hypothetical protein